MEAEREEAGRGPDETGGTVLALVQDLIFASKIRGAAGAAGVATRVTGRAADLIREARARRPGLILLDLDHRGVDVSEVIEGLKADPSTSGVPVVGFVSHVNEAAIRGAREAGADRVLARSAFVRELPDILRSASSAA